MPAIDVACPKCHKKTAVDPGDTPPGKQPVIKCQECFFQNPLATWVKEREKQAAAVAKEQKRAEATAVKARADEAAAERRGREWGVRNAANVRLAKERAESQAAVFLANERELASRKGAGCQRCGSTNLEQRTRYKDAVWERFLISGALLFSALVGGVSDFHMPTVVATAATLGIVFFLTALMQTVKIAACLHCGWTWRV